jgi:hypothetical protein
VTPDLFQLLPAVYRLRDAKLAQSQALLTAAELAELSLLQGMPLPLPPDRQAELDALTAKAARGPLQSLLMLIGEQIADLAYDLDQLYDDQFIETCADWVIPYIGDLIGYQSIKGISAAVDNPRSEVAETISLRRRKGTVLVIEQLARDVTGWGAHAVEFFRVLADTQCMNHIRRGNHYAPDLRRWQTGFYADTGFDDTAHKVDVRRIATGLGRYNIQNIGIFLWSLSAYSITDGAPNAAASNTASGQFCYRFSPLGMDMPLFHRAVSQGEQLVAAAAPVNVVDRLRRRVMCDDLRRGVGAAYYGIGKSLILYTPNGQPLNPYQIQIANLSGADGAWANLPDAASPYAVVIDPELGRLALPPTAAGSNVSAPTFSYFYGFNSAIGGGEYARSANFRVTDPASVVSYPDPRFASLQDALNFAIGQFALRGTIAVEIAGSGSLSLTGGLGVDLPAGATLELRAADPARPTLLLDGELAVSGAASSTFILNGLVVAAGAGMIPAVPPAAPAALIHLPSLRPGGAANQLATLELTDCTLVPGWSVDPDGTPLYAAAPALIAEPAGVAIAAERAILGAFRTTELASVGLGDSIVDATDRTLVAYAGLDGESGGGALTLQTCTVVGKVHAGLLTLASDSIFWAALAPGDIAPWISGLVVDRKQQGCARFSFLPFGAITPRRFECIEAALAGVEPVFLALRYGHPAYMKLAASTDNAIRRGAYDGGEMGSFHLLMAPQRETDLGARLQEYMPVGLEFGLIYQN